MLESMRYSFLHLPQNARNNVPLFFYLNVIPLIHLTITYIYNNDELFEKSKNGLLMNLKILNIEVFERYVISKYETLSTIS